MALTRIRLELGRTEGFPDGSSSHGYEFIAPLTRDGHIDSSSWLKFKDKCRVRRFWGADPDEVGLLKRHGERGWYFDYRRHDQSDDEPFFKLDTHRLTKDGYVSITEHDGVQRPFKIVVAQPVPEIVE
jgi:hypothetical protein